MRPYTCAGLPNKISGKKVGFISKAEWTNGLNIYATYGIGGYTRNNPAFAYNNVIDMSFFDAALPGDASKF